MQKHPANKSLITFLQVQVPEAFKIHFISYDAICREHLPKNHHNKIAPANVDHIYTASRQRPPQSGELTLQLLNYCGISNFILGTTIKL